MLVLSASIGEGHDLPARDHRRRPAPGAPGHPRRASRTGCWPWAGRSMRGRAGRGADGVAGSASSSSTPCTGSTRRWRPTRRLGSWLLETLGGPRLLALIAAERPDIVVATYPGVDRGARGACAGMAGSTSRSASAITDLAGLHYWAHPGIDLHLVIHRESIEEARAIAPGEPDRGGARAFARLLHPRDSDEARRALDLPADGPDRRVSGGGWAIGDLEGAAEAALRVPGRRWCALRAHRGAAREHGRALPRRRAVRAIGFTDGWATVAAADALIHSTVGLTVLEAIIRGARSSPTAGGAAHIRANNHAYRASAWPRSSTTRAELDAALRRALRPSARAGALAHATPSAGGGVLARRDWGPLDPGCEAASRTAPATTANRPTTRTAPPSGWRPVLAADERHEDDGHHDLERQDAGATRVAGRRCRRRHLAQDADPDATAASAASRRRPRRLRWLLGDRASRRTPPRRRRRRRRRSGAPPGRAPAPGPYGATVSAASVRARQIAAPRVTVPIRQAMPTHRHRGDHERAARISRRPTGSSRMRTPRKSSSSRPSARVGCTIVNGASEQGDHLQRPASERQRRARRASAAGAQGWPTSESAQRVLARGPARLQRLQRVPGRRSRRRPRRHSPDRAAVDAIRDHPSGFSASRRSARPPRRGRLPAAGARRAAAGAGRARCGIEGRPPAARGYALTFDNGPHPRARRRCSRACAGRRARDLLPRRRAGAPRPGARAPRSSRPGTRSRCTATATATSCA